MTVAIFNYGLPGMFRWPSVSPLLLIIFSLFLTACTFSSTADAEVLALGKEVYNTNCASCHGLKGEGQPNWKVADENGVRPAPPHDDTGHTWHHPDSLLLELIAKGSPMPGSTMIGYEDLLSPEEMEASLEYIKTFWGGEEREFQTEVTQQTGG